MSSLRGLCRMLARTICTVVSDSARRLQGARRQCSRDGVDQTSTNVRRSIRPSAKLAGLKFSGRLTIRPMQTMPSPPRPPQRPPARLHELAGGPLPRASRWRRSAAGPTPGTSAATGPPAASGASPRPARRLHHLDARSDATRPPHGRHRSPESAQRRLQTARSGLELSSRGGRTSRAAGGRTRSPAAGRSCRRR